MRFALSGRQASVSDPAPWSSDRAVDLKTNRGSWTPPRSETVALMHPPATGGHRYQVDTSVACRFDAPFGATSNLTPQQARWEGMAPNWLASAFTTWIRRRCDETALPTSRKYLTMGSPPPNPFDAGNSSAWRTHRLPSCSMAAIPARAGHRGTARSQPAATVPVIRPLGTPRAERGHCPVIAPYPMGATPLWFPVQQAIRDGDAWCEAGGMAAGAHQHPRRTLPLTLVSREHPCCQPNTSSDHLTPLATPGSSVDPPGAPR